MDRNTSRTGSGLAHAPGSSSIRSLSASRPRQRRRQQAMDEDHRNLAGLIRLQHVHACRDRPCSSGLTKQLVFETFQTRISLGNMPTASSNRFPVESCGLADSHGLDSSTDYTVPAGRVLGAGRSAKAALEAKECRDREARFFRHIVVRSSLAATCWPSSGTRMPKVRY